MIFVPNRKVERRGVSCVQVQLKQHGFYGNFQISAGSKYSMMTQKSPVLLSDVATEQMPNRLLFGNFVLCVEPLVENRTGHTHPTVRFCSPALQGLAVQVFNRLSGEDSEIRRSLCAVQRVYSNLGQNGKLAVSVFFRVGCFPKQNARLEKLFAGVPC